MFQSWALRREGRARTKSTSVAAASRSGLAPEHAEYIAARPGAVVTLSWISAILPRRMRQIQTKSAPQVTREPDEAARYSPISTSGGWRLVPVLVIAVALGCHGGGPHTSVSPEGDRITQTLPVDQLYFLEASGVPPSDTVVSIKVGEPRTVILRHAPPDNNVFAELIFPATAFGGDDATDSVVIVVHPRPGLYALDVAMTLIPRNPGTIRFKYAVHFAAPQSALQKYGNAVRFEQTLQVAKEGKPGTLAMLSSTRRASDNLESRLTGPGTYFVVGPK